MNIPDDCKADPQLMNVATHSWVRRTSNKETAYLICKRCGCTAIRQSYGKTYTSMDYRGLTCDEVIVKKIHEA
jgi:hypothetical protein